MMRINIEVTTGRRLAQIHEIQVVNKGPIDGRGTPTMYKVTVDGVTLDGIVLHDRSDGAIRLAVLALEEALVVN